MTGTQSEPNSTKTVDLELVPCKGIKIFVLEELLEFPAKGIAPGHIAFFHYSIDFYEEQPLSVNVQLDDVLLLAELKTNIVRIDENSVLLAVNSPAEDEAAELEKLYSHCLEHRHEITDMDQEPPVPENISAASLRPVVQPEQSRIPPLRMVSPPANACPVCFTMYQGEPRCTVCGYFFSEDFLNSVQEPQPQPETEPEEEHPAIQEKEESSAASPEHLKPSPSPLPSPLLPDESGPILSLDDLAPMPARAQDAGPKSRDLAEGPIEDLGRITLDLSSMDTLEIEPQDMPKPAPPATPTKTEPDPEIEHIRKRVLEKELESVSELESVVNLEPIADQVSLREFVEFLDDDGGDQGQSEDSGEIDYLTDEWILENLSGEGEEEEEPLELVPTLEEPYPEELFLDQIDTVMDVDTEAEAAPEAPTYYLPDLGEEPGRQGVDPESPSGDTKSNLIKNVLRDVSGKSTADSQGEEALWETTEIRTIPEWSKPDHESEPGPESEPELEYELEPEPEPVPEPPPIPDPPQSEDLSSEDLELSMSETVEMSVDELVAHGMAVLGTPISPSDIVEKHRPIPQEEPEEAEAGDEPESRAQDGGDAGESMPQQPPGPYYNILELESEPFSNSPDPDFFYPAWQHTECLRRLEISVRLKRGLNVVLGDVGTGKTTMCRQLYRVFSGDESIVCLMYFEPLFSTSREFLRSLCQVLTDEEPDKDTDEHQMLETCKNKLFQLAIDEEKNVVLMFDEGQRLPIHCLEMLRLLLNYETQDHKLLQIVIFAQKEFTQTVDEVPNFKDRINELIEIEPLDYVNTREMILYRLRKAQPKKTPPQLFTKLALWTIYKLSRGYPRKIVNLCHKTLLTLILTQSRLATRKTVYKSARMAKLAKPFWRRWPALLLVLLAVAATALLIWRPWADRSTPPAAPVQQSREMASEQPPAPDDKSETAPSEKSAAPEMPETAPEPQPQPEEATVPEPESQPLPPVAESQTFEEPPSLEEGEMPSAPEAAPEVVPKVEPAETETQPAPPSPGLLSEAPPHTLGTLTVTSDDGGAGLSGLIHEFYGIFDPAHTGAVAAANPNVSDINVLLVGMTLNFPAIETEPFTLPRDRNWITLGMLRDLQSAHDRLREIKQLKSGVVLLPVWQPSTGLVFHILDNRFFSVDISQYTALEAIQELPPSLQPGAAVVTGWEDGAVFFSNKLPRPETEKTSGE